MKIKIENIYEDGHECSKVVELADEPTAADINVERERSYSNGDVSEGEWWDAAVYEFTGCGWGKPENHGGKRTLTAASTATITEANDPQLVGMSQEWIG